MERLLKKINTAKQAVLTLHEQVPAEKFSRVIRDATIQRFVYSFEATWKAAKEYLRAIEGLDVASPKGVIRNCLQAGLLEEHEVVQAFAMVDDRNMTPHTYHEGVAQGIYEHIPVYVELLDCWLERMQKGVEKEQVLF